MNTWTWEDEKLFNINKELQQLIDKKIVKTVVSMSLVHVPHPKEIYKYSAILIYK
jgi:hypothetical protein